MFVSFFFIDNNKVFPVNQVEPFRPTLELAYIPEERRKSVIVPAYAKVSGSSSRKMSHPNACDAILRRLSSAHKIYTRENQAGLQPGWSHINLIFALRQKLRHMHIIFRSVALFFFQIE